MRLFLFSEDSRTLLTGIKVLPSVQPSVSIRNPNLYACFAWSYTFARSSVFFERLRSNIELSMINTLARSCESSGRIASLMILPARMVVKRIQLIWTIFIKRYTVSLAKARVFLHEIRFLYASV